MKLLSGGLLIYQEILNKSRKDYLKEKNASRLLNAQIIAEGNHIFVSKKSCTDHTSLT